MLRLMLTDDMWSRVRPALYACGVYEKKRLRIIIEGILWRMRIGSPWRDLPTEFGPWKTIYNQFNRWSKRGILERLFFILRGELDKEWHFMDATIVKAHQHSIGVMGSSPQKQGIGKTAGGNTTKVHMLCDSHGNPIDFDITPGHVHDVKQAEYLIRRSDADYIVADKGYDSDKLRTKIKKKNQLRSYPRRSLRKEPIQASIKRSTNSAT